MADKRLDELKNIAYLKATNLDLVNSVRIEAIKAYALLTMAENQANKESEGIE